MWEDLLIVQRNKEQKVNMIESYIAIWTKFGIFAKFTTK